MSKVIEYIGKRYESHRAFCKAHNINENRFRYFMSLFDGDIKRVMLSCAIYGKDVERSYKHHKSIVYQDVIYPSVAVMSRILGICETAIYTAVQRYGENLDAAGWVFYQDRSTVLFRG